MLQGRSFLFGCGEGGCVVLYALKAREQLRQIHNYDSGVSSLQLGHCEGYKSTHFCCVFFGCICAVLKLLLMSPAYSFLVTRVTRAEAGSLTNLDT